MTQLSVYTPSAEMTNTEKINKQVIKALLYIVTLMIKGGNTDPYSPVINWFNKLSDDLVHGRIDSVIDDYDRVPDDVISNEEIDAFMELEKYSD